MTPRKPRLDVDELPEVAAVTTRPTTSRGHSDGYEGLPPEGECRTFASTRP